MPRWDFECGACGEVVRDVIGSYEHLDALTPHHCGQPMEMLYGNPTLEFFEPYVCPHIDPDGHPVKIMSRRHLSELENRYGVVRVDDPDLVMRGGKLVKESKTKRQYFT